MIDEKKCCYCKKIKSLEEFGDNGRNRMCKQCVTKSSEYQKEHAKKYPNRALFKRVKATAKRKGIEFSLELKYIKIPKKCPILDIPLDKRDRNHTPSIDRIDNKIGYIKENIKIISFKANNLKSNATIEQLKKIIKYMEKFKTFK